MIEDDGTSNHSGNRPFDDVLRAHISRRGALAGGAVTVAAAFAGTGGVAGAQSTASSSSVAAGRRRWSRRDNIDFAPVINADTFGSTPVISSDYEYDVLIPWGTPLQPGGPEFAYPPTSAAAQEQQIGIGHDGMWLFPNGRNSALLCLNHEFGSTSHVLGKSAPESVEDVRIMQAAHGVSVVRLQREGGRWAAARSRKNRRITVNTPVRFSGPARDGDTLKTPANNAPAGTLNNCANGYTPWGTYLTCEENFNGYFGATGPFTPTPEQARYGLNAFGFGYGWFNFDPRFDLSNPDYSNEENRFGWVVEIDPRKPNDKPLKRTALGRFKHEGAAIAIGRGGRAVAYMGDDERFDYIYKFVSSGNHRSMLARGQSPLDSGKLYCARFDDDGSGEWLELTIDNPNLAAAFADQSEVLTYARMAADILGATPMDRPEWTTVAPNGDVYCTLTNNSRRTEPDAANPQAPNLYGHIIKWTDSDRHVGTDFQWEIAFLATDSHGTESQYGSPDGLWADPDGRLFIATDGSQPDAQNNQLLVANDDGVMKRLLSGVPGDEITGITVDHDRRTLFVNIQHPGNGNPALTNFPAPTDGVTVPRDCMLAIRRKDGGIVGS